MLPLPETVFDVTVSGRGSIFIPQHPLAGAAHIKMLCDMD